MLFTVEDVLLIYYVIHLYLEPSAHTILCSLSVNICYSLIKCRHFTIFLHFDAIIIITTVHCIFFLRIGCCSIRPVRSLVPYVPDLSPPLATFGAEKSFLPRGSGSGVPLLARWGDEGKSPVMRSKMASSLVELFGNATNRSCYFDGSNCPYHYVRLYS